MEIGHFIPLAQLLGLGDAKFNLQLLCRPCNKSKSDKLPWE